MPTVTCSFCGVVDDETPDAHLVLADHPDDAPAAPGTPENHNGKPVAICGSCVAICAGAIADNKKSEAAATAPPHHKG